MKNTPKKNLKTFAILLTCSCIWLHFGLREFLFDNFEGGTSYTGALSRLYRRFLGCFLGKEPEFVVPLEDSPDNSCTT